MPCMNSRRNASARAMKRLTDSHQHEEPSHKATKVRGRIAGTVHEIIGIRTSRADPIGERRYDIGCDNDERQEIVPERRGENDQEKANGEDLHRENGDRRSVYLSANQMRATYKGEGDDGLESGRHDCGGTSGGRGNTLNP